MTVVEKYKHGTFSWVDLVAHDLGAATEFYGNLFGWRAAPADTDGGPPYTMFRLRDVPVAGGGQMSDEMKSQGIPPMWNSYINVDDIQAVADQASELGATITVPPMKVMDAGWLAFIKDPTGGHVGFWQDGEHCGAGLVNEPGAFCWNELATRDIDAASEFYGQLLGWTYKPMENTPSRYLIIENDGRGNGGLLQMNEEWGDLPPHWMVYFSVADTEASAARVKELGGAVNVPPFDTSVGKISVVADPQGGHFSLIQLDQ